MGAGSHAPAFMAPHPAFRFPVVDYDGQQTTVFGEKWTAADGGGVDLRAECWVLGKSRAGGWPFATSNDAGYIFDGACKPVFDGDGVGGNMLKFDFDFGRNETGEYTVYRENKTAESVLFGSDLYRCPNQGMGLPICEGGLNGDACVALNGEYSACSGNAMFSQHVVHAVDFPFIDVDNVNDIGEHISRRFLWWSGKEHDPRNAIVSHLFSAYMCYSGRRNQPPIFSNGEVSVEKNLQGQAARDSIDNEWDLNGKLSGPVDTNVPTERTCTAGEECVLDLHAVDLHVEADGETYFKAFATHPRTLRMTKDVIRIENAVGWDNGAGTLTNLVGEQCESVGSHGTLTCQWKETFPESAAGAHVVRCFSALDPHGDRVSSNATLDSAYHFMDGLCSAPSKACSTGETEGPDKLTCRSAPLCIKILIKGRAPHFVEPTPLEANSYSDSGRLVEGQTDVPACEGYPLDLTIRAADDDAGDEVRIFLEDKDFHIDPDEAAFRPLLALRGKLLGLDSQLSEYNYDFFSNQTSSENDPFLDRCAGTAVHAVASQQRYSDMFAGFEGYNARKVGDNAGQRTALSLQEGILPKSVMSSYGTDLEFDEAPNLEVVYSLSLAERNGLVVRLADAGRPIWGEVENCLNDDADDMADNRCRERLLNMDQTICAVAYDNSRTRWKRWVGMTDPNNVPFKQLRDHSNGDMASTMHCWRIRLQSPPVFVTDPLKLATPFGEDWDLVARANQSITEVAYQVVETVVGQEVSYTFIAQDPNWEDSVQIFIADDPGMPEGMSVSRSECIPRGPSDAGDTSLCGAQGTRMNITGYEKLVSKESRCSKAMLTLTWVPTVAQAGQVFTVCALARDSSTMCAGKGPASATSVGWYGERQCIEFDVSAPGPLWDNGISPQDIDAYVGCVVRVVPHIVDISLQYDMRIEVHGELPPGATLTDLVVQPRGSATLTWVPRRGTEGKTYSACFIAKDALGTGAVSDTACWTFAVQRCQYCINTGDTLGLLMKDYALDTNWMRIWLHNGNNIPPEQNTQPVVDNPDLIMTPRTQASVGDVSGNAEGFPIVYVGPVYQARDGDSLGTVAARFRTTVGAILSVNPAIEGEADLVPRETELCIVPCAQRHTKGAPTA